MTHNQTRNLASCMLYVSVIPSTPFCSLFKTYFKEVDLIWRTHSLIVIANCENCDRSLLIDPAALINVVSIASLKLGWHLRATVANRAYSTEFWAAQLILKTLGIFWKNMLLVKTQTQKKWESLQEGRGKIDLVAIQIISFFFLQYPLPDLILQYACTKKYPPRTKTNRSWRPFVIAE